MYISARGCKIVAYFTGLLSRSISEIGLARKQRRYLTSMRLLHACLARIVAMLINYAHDASERDNVMRADAKFISPSLFFFISRTPSKWTKEIAYRRRKWVTSARLSKMRLINRKKRVMARARFRIVHKSLFNIPSVLTGWTPNDAMHVVNLFQNNSKRILSHLDCSLLWLCGIKFWRIK